MERSDEPSDDEGDIRTSRAFDRARPVADDAAALAAMQSLQRRMFGVMVDLPRVDRYEIRGRIGAGSMGVVYEAFDPRLDRQVALKVVESSQSDAMDRLAYRDRLRREAQILAKLSHPNIVAVYDVGTVDDRPYLAMEYVDGENMAQWLGRQSRSWPEVLEVFIQATRGMAAAHGAGLVHRDIKPSNVLIGRDGRVRLVDFGLATPNNDLGPPSSRSFRGPKDEEATTVPTRLFGVAGTPAYMAPEQFFGEGADARTDIFSLCVTLWEALYGERPFAGDSIEALVHSTRTGAIRPPPRGTKVPLWLQQVCKRGLAETRHNRWPTADALCHALAGGRRRRSRRVAFGVVTSVTAVLGVLTSAPLWLDDQPEACSTRLERPRAWSPSVRARMRRVILDTHLPNARATADRLQIRIDDHSRAWSEIRDVTCTASSEPESEPGRFEATWSCLDEQRFLLDALVDELIVDAPSLIDHALPIAADLLSVDQCRSANAMELTIPRGTSSSVLARAEVLSRAGDFQLVIRELQPLVRAAPDRLEDPSAIRATLSLGRALVARGAHERGRTLLERAYEGARRTGAAALAAEAATELITVVGVVFHDGRGGHDWSRRAKTALDWMHRPTGRLKARRLYHLAELLQQEGAFDQATGRAMDSLSLERSWMKPDDPRLVESLLRTGTLLQRGGDAAGATRLFEDAILVAEVALGEHHPSIASAIHHLVPLLIDHGARDRSRALAERAFTMAQASGPEHSEAMANALESLARVHRALGEHQQAASARRRALTVWRQLTASRSRHAACARELARDSMRLGEHHQARKLAEEAVEILDSLRPEEPLELARALEVLADADGRVGEHTLADKHLRQAVDLYGLEARPQDATWAEGMLVLANTQPDEMAWSTTLRASMVFDRLLVPSDPRRIRGLNLLAERSLALGRTAEATSAYENACRLAEQAATIDPIALAECTVGTAEATLASDRPSDALTFAEAALSMTESQEIPPWLRGRIRFALARVSMQINDRDRATVLAREALFHHRASHPPDARQIAAITEWMQVHDMPP